MGYVLQLVTQLHAKVSISFLTSSSVAPPKMVAIARCGKPWRKIQSADKQIA